MTKMPESPGAPGAYLPPGVVAARKRALNLLAYRPRGPMEARERALKLLLKSSESLSEQMRAHHTDNIDHVAATYWYHVACSETAPTAADLRTRLKTLHKQTAALAKTLGRMDGYVCYELYHALEAVTPRTLEEWRIDKGFSVWRDGSSSMEIDRELTGLLARLQADLSRLEELSSLAASRKPVGGRGNLHDRFYVNPTAQLTRECGNLVHSARPDLMSGHVDGQFAAVVSAIYEYATGKEGTAPGAGLQRYVKHYGGLFARLHALDLAFDAGDRDSYDETRVAIEALLDESRVVD